MIKCNNTSVTSAIIIKELKKTPDKIYYINNDPDFHEKFKETLFNLNTKYNDDVCRSLFNYSQ